MLTKWFIELTQLQFYLSCSTKTLRGRKYSPGWTQTTWTNLVKSWQSSPLRFLLPNTTVTSLWFWRHIRLLICLLTYLLTCLKSQKRVQEGILLALTSYLIVYIGTTWRMWPQELTAFSGCFLTNCGKQTGAFLGRLSAVGYLHVSLCGCCFCSGSGDQNTKVFHDTERGKVVQQFIKRCSWKVSSRKELQSVTKDWMFCWNCLHDYSSAFCCITNFVQISWYFLSV